MSSVEQFEYHLYTRDDATPAMKQTSAAALTLSGELDKVQRSALNLDSAIAKIGQGAGFVRNSFTNVGASAKALKERMEPAAAAISGVGAALGAAGGQAGKFVGAALQGAAAFGAAGPWGIALVGGTIALDEYTKTSKEAAAAEAVWKTALDRTLPAQERTRDIVKSLADEAKRYAEETRNAGKTQYEVSIATALAEKAALEAKLANIDASERLRQMAVNTAQGQLESARAKGNVEGMAQAQERLDMALLVQKEVRENAVVYRSQVASLEDSVWKIGDAWAAVETKTKAAGAATAKVKDEAARTVEQIADDYIMKTREEAVAHRRETEAARLKSDVEAAKDRAKKVVEIEKHAAEMREAIQKDLSEKRKKAQEEEAAREKELVASYVSLGQGAFMTLSSTANDYFRAKAEGEKHAEEKAISSSLRATGEQLIALGTKQMFEGGGMMLVGDPRGAPLLGLGIAATATGAAMSGGAAAWSGNIAKREAAEKESEKAKKEKGPSTLGGAGREVVAGTSVTIVYGGISGPTAEHGVHAWSNAMTEAGGRFGLADSRTVDR